MEKEVLYADCRMRFDAISNGLSKINNARKVIPKLRLRIDEYDEFNAYVRLGSSPRIILNDGVLFELHSTISSHGASIWSSLKSELDGVEVDIPMEEALDSIYDLSLNFFLEHEVQHVLCGHVDFDKSTGETNQLYSEKHSGVEQKSDNDQITVSYYLETEADNTALEWMVARNAFECINRIFRHTALLANYDVQGLPVNELPAKHRLLAYRMVLAGVWVSIALLERVRIRGQPEASCTHPLSAARLLSATQTLMLWYVGFDSLKINRDGEMLASLSERDVRAMREFLQFVLAPVASGLQGVPDEESSASFYRAVQSRDSAGDVAGLLKEMGRMLIKQPAKTMSGQQLEGLEIIRNEMVVQLEPYRYLKEMLTMTDVFEIEVTISDATAVHTIQDAVRADLETLGQVEVRSCEAVEMKGLGVAEVAILFIIATAGQLTANEIQRQIDGIRNRRNDVKKVSVEPTDAGDDDS